MNNFQLDIVIQMLQEDLDLAENMKFIKEEDIDPILRKLNEIKGTVEMMHDEIVKKDYATEEEREDSHSVVGVGSEKEVTNQE